MLAYFDCFSGISGDMTLGAFIDLGVPADWLKESIYKIPLTDFDLSV
ncbi:MAG: LarC family nickel insertion protein, partial [Proteobacteria bacterium]|nr:LarC family nickel insertion protein [Pseudomonadota bacterium]